MIMAKDSHGNYVKIEDIKQQDGFKGVSPIDFKSNGDNLKNYRIYGNTVNGESVGDRTGNLFDSNINVISGYLSDKGILKPANETSQITFDYIPIISGTYTFTYTVPPAYDLWFGVCTYDESRTFQSRLVSNYSGTATFTIPDTTKYIRISLRGYNKTPIIMLNEGSTALPYEPYGYKVPVTVEGKNLLPNTATSQTINGVTFTVNSDGSVTCNNTATANSILRIGIYLDAGVDYILSGCPIATNEVRIDLRKNSDVVVDKDGRYVVNGAFPSTFQLMESGYYDVCIRITSGYICNNLTFYPMIRKANIEDGTYEPYQSPVTTNLYLPEQIKMVGDEAEYIDYGEQKQHFADGTSVDVTLPALPTLSGTNTLSVNTNIKPSKVWGGLNDLRDILYVKDKLGNILFSKYYEIEDEPPLTFKAKKAGTLKNYRIYGQTVDGESVGDRTGNLFDGEVKQGTIDPDTGMSDANKYSIRLYTTTVSLKANDTYTVFVNADDGARVTVGYYNSNNQPSGTIGGFWKTFPYSFIMPEDGKVYFVFKKTTDKSITPADISQIMLNEGSTPLPYEPYGYKVPVTVSNGTGTLTTPIYLPEQIRKVGDEAEYIDFREQKQHFVDGTSTDITLPAMPTLSGTNTLTVGTEVQPSEIYLKGKIEKKPKIYYYSQDGQTLLYTESVLKGSNGMYSGTPTKMADPQYTYTFAGWSSSTGQTTATPEVRNNIQNDKNVYAAFSQTLNTYTVYFYNESDTPIETVQNVPYGGTATYTGATPTKQGYSFTGWSPLPTNITADTSCYAQFKEDEMYESITDTWSEIIANVSNGTYSSKYSVGDTKLIDLGTEGKVIMTIVGIDTDDLADNSGKAPITWISKQLLKTSYRMNPPYRSGTEGTGALGGWAACEMRNYLISTIKPLLPSEVRNALKTVKKYSRICNTSEAAVNNVVSNDDIWIPSAYEVNYTGYETSGVTYSTAFPDNASRIKHKVSDSAAWWWLRSARGAGSFRVVGSGGSNYFSGADISGGVAVGFAI